jgi:hypothetical protein
MLSIIISEEGFIALTYIVFTVTLVVLRILLHIIQVSRELWRSSRHFHKQPRGCLRSAVSCQPIVYTEYHGPALRAVSPCAFPAGHQVT